MSKFFITVFLVCVTAYLSGQVNNQENSNGYNIYYYPNGQISSEGNMVNSKPDGLWKSYYVDGTLKSVGKRQNAFLDSVWVFYNNKGKLEKKINYLDGKKNGYYYTFAYFKNKHDSLVGYLRSRELYLNNLKNGISEYYYPDGSLRSAIKYEKGLKHGICREFNEIGILTLIIDYRNGKEVDRDIINQTTDSLKIGVWQEFYPNGKLKTEMNFSQGMLNGLVKNYDLSGELLSAKRFVDGVLVDTAVIIENEVDIIEEFYNIRDENGEFVKKSSGSYIEGKPIGVHRTYDSVGRVNSSRMYDSNGNLIAEGVVNEEGDKLGDWKYYYASKAIKSTGRYRNNRRIGPWSYYYKNGNIEQKGSFKRGVPDGLWKWYFSSGNLKREEYYKLGLENGESIEYDEEGIIIAQGSYLEGLKEGVWKYNFYFHTEEGNYTNDFKEGVWKYFYENTKLYFEGSFSQGNSDGKHIYYHKNGKLKEVRYYIFGRKIKNWEYYDYYGSLIKILTFDNNKLIRIDGLSVEVD